MNQTMPEKLQAVAALSQFVTTADAQNAWQINDLLEDTHKRPGGTTLAQVVSVRQ